MRLNEMHLGLRQLAVVHSTLLSNILAPGRDSCKAEAPQGGYKCSCGRLTPARNHSPWLQLPPPAAAAYSRLFSRRRWSRPGLIKDKREGGHATGKKNGDSTRKSSWHWWIEVDFTGWNQPIKVRFLFFPSLTKLASCCQEELPLYTRQIWTSQSLSYRFEGNFYIFSSILHK